MQNETLKTNLIFISVTFSFIAYTFKKLEKKMSLNDSSKLSNQRLKNENS
jgi:hypothetical protein